MVHLFKAKQVDYCFLWQNGLKILISQYKDVLIK